MVPWFHLAVDADAAGRGGRELARARRGRRPADAARGRDEPLGIPLRPGRGARACPF